MIGSHKDLVLKFGRQIHEVRAVTGDANDEIAILIGFPLGGQQGFPVYDIELEVP